MLGWSMGRHSPNENISGFISEVYLISHFFFLEMAKYMIFMTFIRNENIAKLMVGILEKWSF